MKGLYYISIILLLQSICNTAFGQVSNLDDAPSTIPIFNVIAKKYQKVQLNIDAKTQKTVERLRKKELVIIEKVKKQDSMLATNMLEEHQVKYTALANKIAESKNPTNKKNLKEYIPQLDSINTALSFLKLNNTSTSIGANIPLSQAQAAVQQFQQKLQVANEIKSMLKERKAFLNTLLAKYDVGKYLKAINKDVVYYQQQLAEYKSIIASPKKMERKMMGLLSNYEPFKKFMQKNSQLASMFSVPSNYGTQANLAGLQTIASVQTLLQNRLGGNAGNANQLFTQNLQQAQNVLNQARQTITKLLPKQGEAIAMPDYGTNKQKTKTFMQRLEYGINIQTQRNSRWLPSTMDIAGNIGYKLNDKSVVGVGINYKLGWGEPIKNIQFSHQGIGIKSYVDIKWKKGIWISGGYEQNYFRAFKQLPINNITEWQTSGLLGLTKKMKMGKKTQQIQLLWDFMSYQQVPRTDAIKFRMGYLF